MKQVYNKIITYVFTAFISVIFICTFLFNYKGLISNLYENKDKLFNFSLTEKYFKEAINVAESSYNGAVFMASKFVDLYGGMQRALGKKIIWDSNPNKTIVVGDDGKLYSSGNIAMNFASDSIDDIKLSELAGKLSLFAKEVKKIGSNVILCQAPNRFDADNVSVPILISDSGKKSVDYFYNQLKDDESLTVLNLQDEYKNDGLEFEDLFYATDHHWTVQTAFWAYGELCQKLNDLGFGINESDYSYDSFTVEILKNRFLGSIGERVGRWFVGLEDFHYIYPKTNNSFEKVSSKDYLKSISSGGGVKSSGDFKSAVLSGYEDSVAGRQKTIYGSYVGGDVAEVIIKNNDTANEKKVLFIKDSFSLPVAAFTSTCVRETRLLDLRYFTEQSAYEYVADYKPDAVVVLYSSQAYRDVFFNFGV